MPNRKKKLQAKIRPQDSGKEQSCQVAACAEDQEPQRPPVNPWAAAKQQQENPQSFLLDTDFPPLRRESVKRKGKKEESDKSEQVHQKTLSEPEPAPEQILSEPAPQDPLPPQPLLSPTGCEPTDVKISGDLDNHEKAPTMISELELNYITALNEEKVNALCQEKLAMFKRLEELKAELRATVKERNHLRQELQRKKSGEVQQESRGTQTPKPAPCKRCQGAKAPQVTNQQQPKPEPSLKDLLIPTGCESKGGQSISGEMKVYLEETHQSVVMIPELELHRLTALKEDMITLGEEKGALLRKVEQLTDELAVEKVRGGVKSRVLLLKLESERKLRTKAEHHVKMLQAALQQETEQRKEQAEVIRNLETQRVQLEEDSDRLLKETVDDAANQIQMLQTALQHEREQQKEQAEALQNLKTHIVKWEEDQDRLLAQQLVETSTMTVALKKAQQDLASERQEWQEEKLHLTDTLKTLKENLEENEEERNTTKTRLMGRLEESEHQMEEVQKNRKKKSLKKRFLRLFKRTSHSDLQQQP